MTCTQTVTLGAYLLGALEPPERYEFEAHIARCDNCRTELVRLAPLPGMLNQISVEDFEGAGELYPTAPLPIQTMMAPVPQLLPTLLEPREEPEPAPPAPADPPAPANPSRRRFLRRLAAAAGVVGVVGAGGVFGVQAMRDEPPTPPPQAKPDDSSITWSATAPETDVRVDARLIDHEWGTEIQVKLANLPPNRRCYLIVYDHYGNREVAGWWGTDHDPDEEIPTSTSFKRSWIDKLEFKLDDKMTFLTIPAPVR